MGAHCKLCASVVAGPLTGPIDAHKWTASIEYRGQAWRDIDGRRHSTQRASCACGSIVYMVHVAGMEGVERKGEYRRKADAMRAANVATYDRRNA